MVWERSCFALDRPAAIWRGVGPGHAGTGSGACADAPRKLNPQVPRDLEVICLKCLEKDPRRRYASADSLAEDLKRWLAGEPIAARPVGRFERARLWVRRHPTAAVLAGTSMAALIATIAAGFFIAFNGELKRANRAIAESRAELQTSYASEASARSCAEAAEKVASEQRAIAQKALGEARYAIDQANNFLQAMQISEERLLAPPSLYFPADRFEFLNTMRKNQEIAARIAYDVQESFEPMVRGARMPLTVAAIRSGIAAIPLEPMMRGNNARDRATAPTGRCIATWYSAACSRSRSVAMSTTRLVPG